MTTPPDARRSDAPAPKVSVVICAYTLDRWADLEAAVASVRAQTVAPLEVIVVIDHNDELLARASRASGAWPDVRVLASDRERGLSGARNAGVAVASGEIVAFLDDDAAAEPSWIERLVAPYGQPEVVGSGGYAGAAWDRGRPRWFPPEFDWVVGCSYIGLPTTVSPVRNPIGASMAFRRDAVLEAGGFRSSIGRVGRLPIGGEETELSIRIQAARPDAVVLFVPSARVRHHVPAARSTWHYFRVRCYQEGRSKALISRIAGAGAALAAERSYTTRVLPAAVGRGLRDAAHGDLAGLGRATAVVAGLALTALGYLAGRLGIDPIAGPDTAAGTRGGRSG